MGTAERGIDTGPTKLGDVRKSVRECVEVMEVSSVEPEDDEGTGSHTVYKSGIEFTSSFDSRRDGGLVG